MNQHDEKPLDRLSELLIDLSLQGLTSEELRELDQALESAKVEMLGFEQTVALLSLDLDLDSTEELPDSLRARLETDADRYFASSSIPIPRRSLISRSVPWLGWIVAASLLIALGPGLIPTKTPEPASPIRVGLKPLSLARTDHPLARGSSGTLLWDAERQEGSLVIQGLAEVEPQKGIYQLWIFDENRDERFPVDGGTFVVNDSEKTTTIAIHPSLKVRQPTLFAVTLEPPGGVVVSDRKRILLTASP